MNKLEIRDHIIPSGYKTKVFFIDGRPLYEYIHQWVAGSRELEIVLSPMDDLAICWTDEYDHWAEELYRRRVNYTFPYYQNDQNIEWFASCSFEFNRKEYDAVVNSCYKDQHIT